MYLTTNPDYDTWRPTGGRDENELSGIIGLHAVLIDKVTGQPATQVSADQWNFTLKDVSHEPGVSMNWPAANKIIAPSPPDLDFKFGNDTVFPNMEISGDGTSVLVKPDPATDANVVLFISSHDWGAWATLNATVRVAGQTIKGHFSNDPDVTDILLPKRQPSSFIADIWKTQHSVPLSMADDDDSETDPVGYPGCVGDGLTLYEEYRGFMENGKHIEGDPKNKDFFVENLVGGDAEPGIFLFTATTGLAVHKDLRQSEMAIGDPQNLGVGPVRLINFNHTQGPHEVDQHGVIVANCDRVNGGVTHLSRAGVHGRPGLTNAICMQWRDQGGPFQGSDLGPTNTHRGVITATDALLQFDIGVAHELSHSVGVDHHGEGDMGPTRFTLLGPKDPRNTTGQPVFIMEGGTTLVHLLDEVTGQDRGAVIWADITQRLTEACGTVNALYGPALFSSWCQVYVDGAIPIFTNVGLYVGSRSAQHSGNDQCMMRYFFANAYQSAKDTSAYYISAAGTEPTGTDLCPSPAGTGVNGPNHSPQPRYFDAATGRGGCQNWVCVNDNNAPAGN
jgi:hypothetical protein